VFDGEGIKSVYVTLLASKANADTLTNGNESRATATLAVKGGTIMHAHASLKAKVGGGQSPTPLICLVSVTAACRYEADHELPFHTRCCKTEKGDCTGWARKTTTTRTVGRCVSEVRDEFIESNVPINSRSSVTSGCFQSWIAPWIF
jgi:hypothetical protein